MKKTYILSYILRAVLVVVTVLCLPPGNLGVRSAQAADPTKVVELAFLVPPPDTMCLNDTVPVSFSWQLFLNPGKGKPTQAATTGSGGGVITASAASGTLAKTSFSLFVMMGSGEYSTTYTAKKEGTGSITLTPGGDVSGDPIMTDPFKIVSCTKTISIAASNYKVESAITMDTEWHGKGGLKVSDKGTVTGGGSYTFTITTTYDPGPSSGLTCKAVKNGDKPSTFNVTGTSFGGGYSLNLEFNPLKIPASNFECVDVAGKKTYVPGYGGGTGDPNSTGFFNPLIFDVGQSQKTFDFGEGGQGSVWLVTGKAAK